MNGMNDASKKMLKERIKIAFSNIPSPQSNNIVKQQAWAELDLERSSVINIFQGKDWKNISAEDLIEEGSMALTLFTNEAFLFFLPAYINAALFSYEKLDESMAIDAFINKLTPPKNLLLNNRNTCIDESLRRERFEALRKLTDEQKKCVRLFLEFMDKEHSDDFFDKDYSFGEIEDSGYILPSPALALELYWGQI